LSKWLTDTEMVKWSSATENSVKVPQKLKSRTII
jgi:hypothetical protein